MPETTFALLTPAPGLVVRDPITRDALPADGANKPLDTYWCRRLRDGDVLIQQDQALAIGAAVGRQPKPSLKTV